MERRIRKNRGIEIEFLEKRGRKRKGIQTKPGLSNR